MSDMPRVVDILEEGPREGFQIEKGDINSPDKIALIDALSLTGVRRIQAASFVNPKLVPSWALRQRRTFPTRPCGSTRPDSSAP
jgi:hydroxymethylglutaryl-CoA lyase